MPKFTDVFPEFLLSCAKLYQAMVPWSLAVLVLSFAFEFWRGFLDFQALMRFLAKLFFIVLLIAQAHDVINAGQLAVEKLVQRTGLVRPETLHKDFKDRLAESVGDPSIKDKSTGGLILSGRFLDAFLYAGMVIISHICLGLIAFTSFIQAMALFVCWACCPVLFALLAIAPVAHLGSAHIMRIAAIICWPLGFTVAATFSDGLLHAMFRDRALAGASAVLSLGVMVESLLILVVVGIWSIISTILAPAFIQRFLVGNGGAAYVAGGAGALALSAAGNATIRVALLAGRAMGAARSVFSKSRGGYGGGAGSNGESVSPPSPPVPPTPDPVSPKASRRLARTNATDPAGSHRLNELLKDF